MTKPKIMTFEVLTSKGSGPDHEARWFWHMNNGNGEVMCHSQMYAGTNLLSRASALRSCKSLASKLKVPVRILVEHRTDRGANREKHLIDDAGNWYIFTPKK